MKRIVSACMALTMMVSLGACSTGGSATTGAATTIAKVDGNGPTLSGTMKVVATSEDYKPLFDLFTQDTGVKVDLLSMSSGEVLSKLRAEGGKPSADLWFGGGIDAFMAAKNDDLLEPVKFAGFDDLAKNFRDDDGYWFAKGLTIVGFLVNDKLLEELKLEAPATWDDLLKPEYEGEIIMSNPAVSGTNYAVINALLQTKGDELGWKYFEGLNKNIAYYGKRGSDPLNKTIAGEFAIGISYIDRGVEALAKEQPVSIIYPSDGIPWVPEGVAVFKNAENAEAAKYFVEWLFTNDDHLKTLAEIDKKDGLKLVKPSLIGVELGYDEAILMKEDLSLFGTLRTEILEKFEPLMGDKASDE